MANFKDLIVNGVSRFVGKIYAPGGTFSSSGATELNINSTSTTGGPRVTVSTSSVNVGLHIGTGGTNRGVYDFTASKWLIYNDGSNVYVNSCAVPTSGTLAKLSDLPKMQSYADDFSDESSIVSAAAIGNVSTLYSRSAEKLWNYMYKHIKLSAPYLLFDTSTDNAVESYYKITGMGNGRDNTYLIQSREGETILLAWGREDSGAAALPLALRLTNRYSKIVGLSRSGGTLYVKLAQYGHGLTISKINGANATDFKLEPATKAEYEAGNTVVINTIATTGSSIDTATKATSVIDYGNGSTTISIGYAGSGLNASSATHFAAYTSGGTRIKDLRPTEAGKLIGVWVE